MGIKNIVVYDHDEVEAHNLSSQAYLSGHVGLPKVEALVALAEETQPGINMTAHHTKFEPSEIKSGDILISAVDSMQARREIASMIPEDVFVIDGRMGGTRAVHATSATPRI
jgi:molybdopterin/thiamine biosynthesis adenylyltransferase